MTTNDNEHIIAKHGDYVRRIMRDSTIVVQYTETCGGPWLDATASGTNDYDDSRKQAKRLQTTLERTHAD